MEKMEKLVRIWKPVLDTLNVSEENYNLFVTYADKLQNELLSVEDHKQNLLPVNLRSLSQLDYDNINITLSDTEHDIFEISELIDKNILPNTNGELQDIEKILLEKLVLLLNSKKELSIYKLVNSIGIREKNETHMEMFLTSSIN